MRSFFARAFCQKEFEAHGLKPVIAQANIAFNHSKGTLRGMHFQITPAAESKLVRCTRGAILDIIVDLRPESPTYPPARVGEFYTPSIVFLWRLLEVRAKAHEIRLEGDVSLSEQEGLCKKPSSTHP